MHLLQTEKPQDHKEKMFPKEDNKLKFPKPLILAMNTDPTVAQRLEDAGYNVEVGTFGTPYRVGEQSKSQALWVNAQVPKHYSESEIVIIDLSTPDILSAPNGQQALDSDGDVIRVHTPFGGTDPRPLAMFLTRSDLDRILNHGGLFIVFAEPKSEITIYSQHDSNFAGNNLNNWDFLTILGHENFTAKTAGGAQIEVTASGETLARTLRQYFSSADFKATLMMEGYYHDQWKPLATNKFGETVAGALIPRSDKSGAVFIFPHVLDKAGFILDLIGNVLPDLYPGLFPFLEEAQWIKQDIYQPQSVLELKEEIREVQDEAKRKVEVLLRRVEAEQESQQYITDLIRQTDQPLVDAVKQALEVIGFQDVRNYDEELQKRGSSEMREDLQIWDRSPLVLVEIKGIKGTSTEDEALQVIKYLFPRVRELGRNDLRGLTILNHQRHLPPLERNPQPFSRDVLTNAQHENSTLGLLTTWNLHKLVRNFLKHGWNHDQVSGIFYQNGFIEPVPLHYKYIGTVERFIEKIGVVGILIKESALKLGDRIAFELPIEYEEQDVASLEFDNKPIEVAQINMLVGVKTSLSKEHLRTGFRVFRIE